jgi:hypothetical protein
MEKLSVDPSPERPTPERQSSAQLADDEDGSRDKMPAFMQGDNDEVDKESASSSESTVEYVLFQAALFFFFFFL